MVCTSSQEPNLNGFSHFLMAKTAGRFNTLRIVPLITFKEVIERCKKVEDGTFFES